MRFFVALVVFTFGIALYAVAALLFDRRHVLAGWHAARRAAGAGEASAASRPAASGPAASAPAATISSAPIAVRAVSALPPSVTITGCLVLGTLLMLGSCTGLIAW
jgi:hypothetical protein